MLFIRTTNRFCYALLFTCLFLAACRKEEMRGGKDYKTLGSAAHDLLSADVYSSMVVEVNYMPGFAPDSGLFKNVEQFLNAHIHKPGGISIISRQITAGTKSMQQLEDIVSIERTVRRQYTGDSRLAVHILITDGYYADSSILATSYWNTSFCLFGQAIKAQCDALSPWGKSIFLTTLFAHEFGHLFGLVDQGSISFNPHRDLEHGAHCEHRSCLMYHAVETSSADTAVPGFDNYCAIDLRGNGGK